MVINIRGTGGAGKSTLVRNIMALYEFRTPSYIEGRKRPVFYICKGKDKEPLFVPGHYDTPTGGCDTLSTVDDVYTLVRSGANGNHVLYEGIMIGDDVKRAVALSKEQKVLVIALSTPIEECLAGIQSRRDKRGAMEVLNPRNTISRLDRLKRSMMPRLITGGVEAVWLSREDAFQRVKKELGL